MSADDCHLAPAAGDDHPGCGVLDPGPDPVLCASCARCCTECAIRSPGGILMMRLKLFFSRQEEEDFVTNTER